MFPHLRSLGEPDEMEEERRLAYVGITRAQERLYLSHAWSRTLYGATQYNPPSRFLDEIPEHLVEAIEQRRPAGAAAPTAAGGYGVDRGAGVDANGPHRRAPPCARRPRRRSGAEQLGLRTGDDVATPSGARA